MLIGSTRVLHFGKNKRASYSLAWPDPIFAQGVIAFSISASREKGLVSFTDLTGTDTFRSVNWLLHHMVQFESTRIVFSVETCL